MPNPVGARAHVRSQVPVLVLLALAQFMLVLDASVVNVALPSMGRDLNLRGEQLAWVVNAYALTFGGLLLAGGRMADLLGGRRMFILGLAVFTGASLVAGLATDAAWLVGARAVQGVGAAVASPAGLALITTTFTEPDQRHRALGVWGAVAAAGGVSGTLLGGLLTQLAGWPWIFLINVPVGLALAGLSGRLPVDSRARARSGAGLPAALTATAGLGVLTFALLRAPGGGWTEPRTVGVGALGVVLLAAFVARERSRPVPLVPHALWRLRSVVGSDVAALFLGMAMIPTFFLFSLDLQKVLGMDALRAGLATLPMSLALVVSAGLATPWVRRAGPLKPALAGLMLVATGLAWLAAHHADRGGLVGLLAPSLVVAAGAGMSFVSSTTGATSRVDPAHAGAAAGLVNTAQELGGAIGLAVVVAIAGPGADHAGPTRDHEVLATQLTGGFLCAGALALAGALVTALLLRRPASAGRHRSPSAVGRVAAHPNRRHHTDQSPQ